MNTAVPGTRIALFAADLMNTRGRDRRLVHPLDHQLAALRPGGEQGEGDEADQQREPAAVRHLGQVGAEIGDVDHEEEREQRHGVPGFQFHSENRTTVSRQVSMNIAPVTAMP